MSRYQVIVSASVLDDGRALTILRNIFRPGVSIIKIIGGVIWANEKDNSFDEFLQPAAVPPRESRRE